jgi:1,4-dihydroxy-2-naphthoate octaprenyltransferase
MRGPFLPNVQPLGLLMVHLEGTLAHLVIILLWCVSILYHCPQAPFAVLPLVSSLTYFLSGFLMVLPHAFQMFQAVKHTVFEVQFKDFQGL